MGRNSIAAVADASDSGITVVYLSLQEMKNLSAADLTSLTDRISLPKLA